MTEPADYTKQKSGYYAKDHLVADFPDLFQPLATDDCLYAGCGRAEALVNFTNWWGFDFNPDLTKVWQTLGIADRTQVSDARKLPFEDYSFDYTVSVDFLEHVKPDDLPTVADELRRVAYSGRHVIHALPESAYRSTTGLTLHPAGHLTMEDWLHAFSFSGHVRPLKPGYLLFDYGDAQLL